MAPIEIPSCISSGCRFQSINLAAVRDVDKGGLPKAKGCSMRISFTRLTIIIMVGLWAIPAGAQSVPKLRDVIVEKLWTRATTPDEKSAALYFIIRNTGQNKIDLIGVRTDRASIETLHKTTTDAQGTARMSALPELRVAPGETVAFEPGSLHVMLIDLETPLVEGETLPLRLKFYDGDDITVDVPILAPDATGPVP